MNRRLFQRVPAFGESIDAGERTGVLSRIWNAPGRHLRLCLPAAVGRLRDPGLRGLARALLELIPAETIALDVAFPFLEDARYANEWVKKGPSPSASSSSGEQTPATA